MFEIRNLFILGLVISRMTHHVSGVEFLLMICYHRNGLLLALQLKGCSAYGQQEKLVVATHTLRVTVLRLNCRIPDGLPGAFRRLPVQQCVRPSPIRSLFLSPSPFPFFSHKTQFLQPCTYRSLSKTVHYFLRHQCFSQLNAMDIPPKVTVVGPFDRK